MIKLDQFKIQSKFNHLKKDPAQKVYYHSTITQYDVLVPASKLFVLLLKFLITLTL